MYHILIPQCQGHSLMTIIRWLAHSLILGVLMRLSVDPGDEGQTH